MNIILRMILLNLYMEYSFNIIWDSQVPWAVSEQPQSNTNFLWKSFFGCTSANNTFSINWWNIRKQHCPKQRSILLWIHVKLMPPPWGTKWKELKKLIHLIKHRAVSHSGYQKKKNLPKVWSLIWIISQKPSGREERVENQRVKVTVAAASHIALCWKSHLWRPLRFNFGYLQGVGICLSSSGEREGGNPFKPHPTIRPPPQNMMLD